MAVLEGGGPIHTRVVDKNIETLEGAPRARDDVLPVFLLARTIVSYKDRTRADCLRTFLPAVSFISVNTTRALPRQIAVPPRPLDRRRARDDGYLSAESIH